MKRYNVRIEVTRVFKHFILEWENADKGREHFGSGSTAISGYVRAPDHVGTEVHDSKEQLLKRIEGLLS